VEIGGGFRVPDVMKQSGAKLVEIGTTNKVRVADYSIALEEPTALVMRAHRSNFKIVGFTEEPEFKDMVDAAHKVGVPVVDDLGSGALYDTAKYGFSHEPTVQESMQAGADVILFSGDKLLGGPQAGIIIGKKDLLDKIKKHPLARAVRADKSCLAGISATLTHYLKDEAEREIPIVRMMSLTLKQVKGRAEAWRDELRQGNVVVGQSTVGGGSLPDESIPTFLLELQVKSAEKFLRALRKNNPPIIARTENDKVLLDPRTVFPEQEGALLVGLKNLLKKENK
ncbi:MAG TPA: L-seryl-tRNA(Sec) selenium transferase, partial [Anaerolineales bacterium]|nr:L-seryl-tRNA(Sec) selenium transferase [Anaerolineales bacterium]